MRIMGMVLIALFAALALPAAARAADDVKIHIQVIEATKKSDKVDPRVEKLEAAMPGYTGAKLVDEVQTSVQQGASVSLEIMDRTKTLKVTVREIAPDGTIKLTVGIEAFKFSTNTTHKKGAATVVVGHPTGEDTALFLAVTPSTGK